MIEFTIKPDYYKQIHNAINAVYEECRLNFTKNRLETILVDPSNAIMGSIEIEKTVFELYNVDEIETIGYMLNKFGSRDDLNMFLDSETNHHFVFYREGDKSKVKITHDIFIDQITLPESGYIRKQPKIPNLDLPCTFYLPVSMFKKIIKRGEYFRFVVEDNHLICDGQQDDTKWHTEPMRINQTKDVNARYSTDFIKDIATAIPDNIDTLKISIDTDYPCTIEFSICDGKVPVKYLIAPRIQDL